MTREAQAPLVLHVLHRFDTGGLENGVVNLINGMPASQFRHAVLAIDTVAPAFAARLCRNDVQLLALNKPPGHALKLYPRIWRLLHDIKPSIVHTRNMAALELLTVASIVPTRDPRMFTMAAASATISVDPSGSPQTARKWFSN